MPSSSIICHLVCISNKRQSILPLHLATHFCADTKQSLGNVKHRMWQFEENTIINCCILNLVWSAHQVLVRWQCRWHNGFIWKELCATKEQSDLRICPS